MRGISGTPSSTQLVGQAVNRDRFQAGIAENDLVMALGRRVAEERRFHVQFEHRADVRQPAHQLDGLLLGQGLEVRHRLRIVAFVPQGPGDLLGQLVVQPVDQVADVIFDVADMQILPAHVAGVEDIHQIGEDVDNGFPAGQRLMAEVIDVPALGVRGHQRFGDLGQTFLQPYVCCHGCLSSTPSFYRRRARSVLRTAGRER